MDKAQNENIVANTKDDFSQDDKNRIYELFKKENENSLTDDERSELDTLKKKRHSSYSDRIRELTQKTKAIESQLEKEREERERIARELEEARKSKESAPSVTPSGNKDETVNIEGKAWLTDNALLARIEAGELSEIEANRYARERDKAEAAFMAFQRLKQETTQQQETDIRRKDAEEVLSAYPHFDKNHPNYDPNDRLYLLANEIYREGYSANPRGLSLAVKRAKEILGVNNTRVDQSRNLNLEFNAPPERKSERQVSLTDFEKEAAVRMFTRGDVINPKTGNPYTEKEAIEKALNAKKSRLGGGR